MNRLKRVISGTSVAVLSLSSLLTMGFTGVAHAAVQTCTWTGGGADNKFSTVANWTGCGGGAPLAGDVIRFNQMNASELVLVNDLNVNLGGVLTSAVTSSNWDGYSVDRLDLAAGASIAVEPGSTCSVRIPRLKVTDIAGAGDLSVQTESLAYGEFKAVINGDLTIKSTYGVAIGSFSAGSSATNVIVASPLGTAGYTTATCSSGGGGAFGAGPVVNNLNNLSYGSVTVQNDALMELTTYSKPITFGGGTGSGNPRVIFNPDRDQESNPLSSSRTWSSPVTLLSNADVYVGEETAVNFTGTINGAGKTLARQSTSVGTFTNNATSNNSATPVGEQVNPVKTTQLEGVAATYATVVSNETAVLSGERDGVSVLPGGTLMGTGKVNGGLYVDKGGVVAPGNSPGCLTVETLGLSGQYNFELGGTVACTGYDQIRVTNTTSTSSTTTFGPDASLATSRFDGYTPKQGDSFTIIDVAGAQAVSGTFKDLPEGATFEQNGVVFKITYKGGDGNDVVLTVQNQPTAPDTGFALLSANPLLTLGATAGAAVVLVAMARKTRPAHARVHARRRK